MAPQTVLITGCSSGIGLATAVYLAKEDKHRFKVYATMRNLKSKGNLEKEAGDTLNKTLFIRELDVTKETTIKSVVDEILQTDGRIDVLINNAAVIGVDTVDEKPIEWCQSVMDTNYWGVVRCVRAVIPAMKKQKYGRILNVTSMGGLIAFPLYATYASSKFAVEGFSEAIASLLKEVYNIRVSIVEPGPVESPMNLEATQKDLDKVAKGFDGPLKEVYEKRIKGMMVQQMKMMQTPEDIAKLHMEIILSKEPHLRYQTSEGVKQFASMKLSDPTTDAILGILNYSV